MKQIRRNVFETNSSSTHSLTMCIQSDFDKWKDGKLAWDRWRDKLVEIDYEVTESMARDDGDYLTYEQFTDYDYLEYEIFVDKFTTPSDETVVSFGYYGRDC